MSYTATALVTVSGLHTPEYRIACRTPYSKLSNSKPKPPQATGAIAATRCMGTYHSPSPNSKTTHHHPTTTLTQQATQPRPALPHRNTIPRSLLQLRHTASWGTANLVTTFRLPSAPPVHNTRTILPYGRGYVAAARPQPPPPPCEHLFLPLPRGGGSAQINL